MDFTQLVDSCFRRFLTDFLPLSSLIDVMVIYLVEGIKGLFRVTYAVFKLNKDKIKSLTDKSNLLIQLGMHSIAVMPDRHNQFMKFAQSYPLGTAKKHRFS